MSYNEIAPRRELEPFIRSVWTLEHDYAASSHDHEHLWASANVELIFTYHNRYYSKSSTGKEILPRAFVIGPLTKALDLYSDGVTGLVAVRFWPWGAYPFLQRAPRELVNRTLSAESVFGDKIRTLAEILARKTTAQQIKAVEDFFSHELQHSSEKSYTVNRIGFRIINTNGGIAIADLSREFDLNVRRLERSFRRETGLSPKALSRIVRFNHAKRLIQEDPNINLTRLACDVGFCDQSHFNKTFKEMFGLTPTAFKRKIREVRAALCVPN